MKRKIFCASLTGREMVKARAVLEDDSLIITDLEVIKGAFGTWKRGLRKEIIEKAKQGFSIGIDENTQAFSDLGYSISLSDADPVTNKSYMTTAFELYFSYINQGRLTLEASLERHLISENAVNVSQDDKGRATYSINLRSFNGYQRAILLCVLVANETSDMSMEWVNEFIRHISVGDALDYPTLRAIRNRVL